MALQDGRWSKQHSCCIQCGSTQRIHAGRGYCRACRSKVVGSVEGRWAKNYDHCVECGGVEQRHSGLGKCHRCYSRIKARLRPRGDYSDYSKNRRYHINDHLLDEWNERSAYFVGVMYSDGSLQEGRGHRIQITLSEKDRSWLEAIAAMLNFKGPISVREIRDNYTPRRSAGFACTSIRLCNRLREIGWYTKTLENIPDSVFHHFLRGFFDGDGSVFLYTKYLRVSFTGQKVLLQEIKHRLMKLAGTSSKLGIHPKTNSPITFSICYAEEDSIRIAEFLYRGFHICLERKHQRFIKHCGGEPCLI